MKVLTVLIWLIVGTSAWAQDRPIVVKSSRTGNVTKEWAHSKTCKVYKDKVVIEKRYGRGENQTIVIRTINIQIQGNTEKVIALAAAEAVRKMENDLCDGPRTSIWTLGANNPTKPIIILYSTGGCGEPSSRRVGPYSLRLNDMVNTYCPKTYSNF